MVVTYNDLRRRVQEFQKSCKTLKIDRSPLINPGFPGNFNLSFTEAPWLNEFGRFQDFDHDYNFSTIQSCIRLNDFSLLSENKSSKHLGVFELGDVTGARVYARKPDYETLQRRDFGMLIFLLRHAGIESKDIYPSYCAGGEVRDLTNGRYSADFHVPMDELSRDVFLENGVPKENILSDKSRDTFLSPLLHLPAPWGYRCEINVDANKGKPPEKRLVDIATIEYAPWKPIFQGECQNPANLIAIDEAKTGFTITAVGLERLCMVANDLQNINDVDYIAPVYKAAGKLNNPLTIESLRTLHRIYSDIHHNGCNPGRMQKQRIRELMRNISTELDSEKLGYILTVHSQTQPWHTELGEGIEPTIERIVKYRRDAK